jgi:hypothetical protein
VLLAVFLFFLSVVVIGGLVVLLALVTFPSSVL